MLAAVGTAVQRFMETHDLVKKGMEINPFEKPWELMYSYLSARRYDDAIQEGELRRIGENHSRRVCCGASVF